MGAVSASIRLKTSYKTILRSCSLLISVFHVYTQIRISALTIAALSSYLQTTREVFGRGIMRTRESPSERGQM